jgi:ribosomal silencing factor RsfS
MTNLGEDFSSEQLDSLDSATDSTIICRSSSTAETDSLVDSAVEQRDGVTLTDADVNGYSSILNSVT